MRKQELIHLHGLLGAVARHCEETGAAADLDEYESLGVQPTSLHLSKHDHREAVFALTDGITDAVTTSTADAPAATAD